MSQAISAKGTFLKRGDGGSPETFTTLPEVRSISGPSMETDETEVTNHSSPGAFREYVLTLIDAGTVEFDLNYIPGNAVQVAMRNDFINRASRNWQLVLPGGVETWSFTGYVKTMPFEFPTDDVITAKVTIRLTGPVVFS